MELRLDSCQLLGAVGLGFFYRAYATMSFCISFSDRFRVQRQRLRLRGDVPCGDAHEDFSIVINKVRPAPV